MMIELERVRRGVVASVLVLGGVVPGVSAQGVVVDADRAVRIERAEVLADQALVIAKQAGDFQRAASLMQDAALLRGVDEGAVEALLHAGHFAYYAGRGLNAVSAFRRAGETALALGDQATADRAFMNAAWVADREGEVSTVRAMLARVSSPVRAAALTAQLDGA